VQAIDARLFFVGLGGCNYSATAWTSPPHLDIYNCQSYEWLNRRCRMELVWITLAAWAAFAAAAILPGFLLDQLTHNCEKAPA